MSLARPEPKIRAGLGAFSVLLLAAGAIGLASSAEAQQLPLRGVLNGNGAIDPTTTQAQAEPPPAYVPVSPGALPDEAHATAGGADSDDEDAVADDAAPVPTPRPADSEETDDTATGTVRVETIDSAEDIELDPGAERVEAIEGLDRTVEERPFEAQGIRASTFILRPVLEQGIEATTNADSSTTGGDAVLSDTALRLNAVSEWETNSVTVDAYGLFRKTISGDEVEDVAGGLDTAMTLDLGKDYRATATFGFDVRPEDATSPVVVVDAAEQPLRATLNGSLGLEKALGKARFGITGAVESDFYGDADLDDGTTLSQKERNSTLYSVALRAGYEISPAVTPFIETELGRRIYELELDSAGYARSSNQFSARGGVTLDLGEKLSGEISAGWIGENFDDERLESLSGVLFDANLTWSPVRGTIVGLAGGTTLEGSTTPGESGSVLYAGRLTAEREMRANLTGNAALGLGWRDYSGSDGHDLIFNAEAGVTYWLNRYAGVVGRVRHETVQSNLPDRDSETNSVFLGLRLQR